MKKELIFCMIIVCMIRLGTLSEGRPGELSNQVIPETLPSTVTQKMIDFCSKGQYALNDDGDEGITCLPCPEGHYMAEDKHKYWECDVCTSLENHIQHKLLKHNCTPYSDTIFECSENYFMDLNNDCKICARCEHEHKTPYEGSPCTQHSDRRCCEKPDMRVVWNNSTGLYNCVSDFTPSTPSEPPSPNCADTSLRRNGCMAGEYRVFECKLHKHLFYCKSCGIGTFLNLTHHTQKSCTPCSLPEENDSQIVSHCNSTHDNVYKHTSVSPSNNMVLIIKYAAGALALMGIIFIVVVGIRMYRTEKTKYRVIFSNQKERFS